jgi:subtilisin family serine protease
MPSAGLRSRLPLLLAPLLALLLLGLTLAAVSTHAAGPPVLLRLRAGTFDPLRDPPPAPASLVAPSARSPYAVVQFAGPVRPEWRAALEARGAQVLDYLPDYAFVVRLSPGRRAALAGLPHVRWLGDLLPAYRLDPALWSASGPVTLTLQLFPGEDPAAVAQLPGAQVLETARTHWQTTLRLRVDAALLPTLAALPGVRWVEPDVPPEPVNDVALGLTGVMTAWAGLGLTGSGQVVAVADTGLDVGASGPITDFAGRIVAAHSPGRPSTGEWDDPQGHGTHVAGTAVGSGALSGGQFRGAAPGAGLVVQSLYSPTQPSGLYVPSDLNLLLAPVYTDGARIHNDSWGIAGNRYNTAAQTADQFVWDHPDMLVVAASGNGGIDRGIDGLIDPGSLYSPATAKNVLAAGASESERLGQGDTGTYGSHGANFPANPVRDDLISDAPWGLAAFSSRGPADDGRVRPDLVAPGTNVVSARSHHPGAAYPFPYDEHYAFNSGSSQAAPLVSGAAALVRQWYAARGIAAPSAALLRATLIHGATDLAPGQYGPALSGTLVVSDDVEGTGTWTSTTWVMTTTYGSHSPDHAWAAQGTALGFQRLDATLDLSGTVTPTLLFWNRRALDYSVARVYACGANRAEYRATGGGRVGWALEAADITNCAGNAAALIRFEFQCQSYPACSAAVWALDDIVVADGARLAEIGPPPDPGQGWGRLDLVASLVADPPARRWTVDDAAGLKTDQVWEILLPVGDGDVPLRATLVWSDFPALPAAAAALVNDLDLELEVPGGGTLFPNRLSGPDRSNNVEQTTLLAPPTGTYTLRVRAHNVPFGPQPFALVVTHGARQVYLPFVARAE